MHNIVLISKPLNYFRCSTTEKNDSNSRNSEVFSIGTENTGFEI